MNEILYKHCCMKSNYKLICHSYKTVIFTLLLNYNCLLQQQTKMFNLIQFNFLKPTLVSFPVTKLYEHIK